MNVPIVPDRVREWVVASGSFSPHPVELFDHAGSIHRDTEDRDSLFKKYAHRRG